MGNDRKCDDLHADGYNGSSPQKRIHESARGNNRSDPKQLGCIVGIWNMWLTQGPQMLRELAGHPFGITKRPARKCGNSDVVGHRAQQIEGFRTSGDPEVISALGIDSRGIRKQSPCLINAPSEVKEAAFRSSFTERVCVD